MADVNSLPVTKWYLERCEARRERPEALLREARAVIRTYPASSDDERAQKLVLDINGELGDES